MIEEIISLKGRCSKRKNIKVVFSHDMTTFINESDVVIPIRNNNLKIQSKGGRVMVINVDKIMYICLNEVLYHG